MGLTNFRNEMTKFGMKRKDRRLHTYIIGKTGTGKSTLLENMIHDDILEGRGVAVVDPHGQLIEHVLKFIPEHRVKDVVYFNAADHDFPMGFNVLENKDLTPEKKVILTSGVVGVFEKIFGEVSWGPRLEYILRNVILGLLDYPNATMLGIMRTLTDNAYRRLVVNEIKDPTVRSFFVDEYEKYEPKFRQEAIAPIQNKVGQFLSSTLIRNVVGQPVSTIRMDEIMNNGKILLADLSKGRIGEDNSTLLGSLLVTQIQLSAMARTEIPEDERRDFYLYVDEFQNFATGSFATILSEARKYRLNLIMAHQYVAQLPEKVRDAVFGNVGTTITFRINANDATALQKEFEPIFDVNDLVNLDNYTVYLKMAIDGVTVPAFSAATLPPPETQHNFIGEIIDFSRENYAKTREDVEEYILDWSAPVDISNMQNKQEKQSDIVTKREEENSLPKIIESGGVGEKKESKTEILKDRFNRNWYAVSGEVELKPKEEVKSKTEEMIQANQSGGEIEKFEQNDQLITWEKASELGVNPSEFGTKNKPAYDDYLPIDEL
ncbi:type IV secretion system DNA-binding domain-containing protein [Candidatus Berkelbacteria bacterium]|nr:type IV secretion system DNA-binding domain-containing protein [Candidatus Berkelbacteria bacterium]